MGYQSVKYMKPSEFFNDYCKKEIEEIYKSSGTEVTTSLFQYKEYTTSNNYEFYIANIQKTIDYKALEKLPENIPKVLKYASSFVHNKGYIFESYARCSIISVIKHFYELNQDIGVEALKTYHYVCANSKDTVEDAENVWAMKNVLVKYLKDNQLYETTISIDYDASDEQSVTNWFQNAHKMQDKNLPSYNDDEYTPFLIKDKNDTEYYVIENVSSGKLFIYKEKDNHSGSWYMTERNQFKDIDGDMRDALYTSKQYILKNIEEKLNDFSLVVQYENQEVIKATVDMDSLNSVQTYIYGELYKEKKVTLPIEDSFSYMLANFRKDNDYYQNDIDQIHFFNYLKAIKDNPSSLYYHKFQYHKNHDNTPNLEQLETRITREIKDKTNYSHLAQLPSIYKKQIEEYMLTHMQKFDNVPEVKEHLTSVKHCLNSIENEIYSQHTKDTMPNKLLKK